MRWLFHVLTEEELAAWNSGERYRAPSLDREGFIHASFRDTVLESARLYFPKEARLRVLAIDPRQLDVPIEIAETPRGPMPHIRGSIPAVAIRVLALDAILDHPDEIPT